MAEFRQVFIDNSGCKPGDGAGSADNQDIIFTGGGIQSRDAADKLPAISQINVMGTTVNAGLSDIVSLFLERA